MNNLYKIVPAQNLNKWGAHMVGKEENVRYSLDGKKCIVKLPVEVRGEESAQGFKQLFRANEPFLTHSEAKALMATAEWSE